MPALLDTSQLPGVFQLTLIVRFLFQLLTYLLVPFCYFIRRKAGIFYQKFSVLITKFVFFPAFFPKFSVFLCLFVVPTICGGARHGPVESDYPSSLTSNCNKNSFQNIKKANCWNYRKTLKQFIFMRVFQIGTNLIKQ